MRIAPAAAVVAALCVAPAAGAAFGPPLVGVPSTLRTVPIVHLKRTESRAASACNVPARRSADAVGRVERKFAPVACEQPPRSRVLGTGSGFFFRFAP